MKSIKIFNKIFRILFVFLVLSGCTDLEYQSFDQISPSNFPQTPEDIEAAVTSIYTPIGDQFTYYDRSALINNMICTDELHSAWAGDWWIQDHFEWTPDFRAWRPIYDSWIKGMSKATLLLPTLEGSEISDEVKSEYIAEVRALRAWYAFQLLDFFGGVPLVTDPEILLDLSAPSVDRATEAEMVSFIETELVQVISDLPKNSSDSNWGRVNKGVASTMLLKLYLHQKNWTKVVETANTIDGYGDYSLLNYYPDIHDIDHESYSSNPEVIWPLSKVALNDLLAQDWFAVCLPQVPRINMPSGNNNISIWGGLKTPWDFYDKFEEGVDERLTRMIRYYTDVDGNDVDFRALSNHYKQVGANPMKYSEDPDHNGSLQGNDIIIYRYADVLLAKAEALNEINGPTQEAIDLINQIRNRAKVAPIAVNDFAGKDQLRDYILDERGRELWCEGHRRQDLIRHGKLISVAHAQGWTAAKDYHILYPIPQSVMDENPGWQQNPGY